ncbi:hypothetical protein EB118_14410 [bacterium]|nr:hypothetical protein [bacterium]NDD83179.1 hypothetical protein [bacterium]NDG31248.1 hypothetical protein [bacterium]
MKSIVDTLCTELVDYSFTELKNQKNRDKVQFIVSSIINFALKAIRPYLYTIMILLITMFLINAIHFYYYIKMIQKTLVLK